jgi:YVTN family beta-propeller protein
MRFRGNGLPSSIGILLVASLSSAAPDAAYRIEKVVKVGGDGGWDYLTVDSEARRLYVTRQTRVLVFNADDLSSVGEIPNTNGVHGVALAPDLGKGFTSNGRSGTVTIFDVKTLKPLDEVKVTGENPDAILYNPVSRRVFAFNGRSDNVTVLDAGGGRVVGTVALGGKPEFAAHDKNGLVYVNLEDKSEVAVMDAEGTAVLKKWPLAPCEEPSGMAVDRRRGRLFIGCGNRLMAVVDVSNGRVLATLPIGEGVDANGFDAATGLAFSSNGDGTLTIAREDPDGHFAVAGNVTTQRGARTMALDEKTHRVFLATSDFGPAPSPTADQPHPRPSRVPDTFRLLVLAP